MTSKATPTNFNTNIDDYSIEELYNLLELEEFTREQIIISVNYLTTNVFNNNETIKEFFLNIQDKLLNYLTTYNSSFDNMLHANANSNIETNNDDISENEENNLKEGFSDLNMETNPITNDVIQPLSNFVITNVLRKKKFYFDTNQKIYSNEDPTNCKMYVQRTINVIKAKLISLTCKVPLLIHTSKLNNFFTIQKFVGPVCDFSAQIIIDDGYYEESVKMAETINVNIQKYALQTRDQDVSGSEFLQGLTFSFNYLNKSVFELSYNQTSYDISYYAIDFTSTANSYYALSNILGFTSANIINSIIINSDTTRPITLTSPKPYNTISNKLPFFFCFEDNNNSIISNYICQKANVIQSRVLARIAPLTCPQTSNILSTKFNEFNSNVLVYNGRANIENFTVKIIDIYGNILLSIDDDYCFEIEFECEELTSTHNSSIVLPNIV